MDQLLVEPNGKAELKKYNKLSKEEDELSNKDRNKQMEMFKQMFDPRSQEDYEIGMLTGCTACVVLVDELNNKIYCANSGDSRAVLCKKGLAVPLSTDHKPDDAKEKDRIYKAEGWVTEGRVKGKTGSYNLR